MLYTEDVFSNLRNLVIYSPTVGNVRFNSYALLHRPEQLEAIGYGMQYEDFLNGFCWFKDWVYRGCSAAEAFKTEYTSLVIENHSIVKAQGVGNVVMQVFLTVIDTPDCGGRLHTQRTKEKVYEDNFALLFAACNLLESHKRYEVTYPDTSTAIIWAPPGLIAQMTLDGTITAHTFTGVDMKASIEVVGPAFKNLPLSTKDDTYAVTQELSIQACIIPASDGNYAIPDVAKKGIVAYNPITEVTKP